MNNKIINALEEIFLNADLQKEIFSIDDDNQRADKVFELCKEYAKVEFTREEYERTLYEFFVLAFESLWSMSYVNDLDLENIAGGMNFKKITATSLAALSLLGSAPNKSFAMATSSAQSSTEVNSFWDMILKVGKALYRKYYQLRLDGKVSVILQTSVLTFFLFTVVVPGIYKGLKWLCTDFVKDVVKPSARWFKGAFIYDRHKLNNDPVEFRKSALDFLKQNVFAQDKAINSIVNIISGHIDLWRESKETNQPCMSACVMTFIGDSGTGKTFCARLLSWLLFGKDMQPWQFITASSVKAPPPPSNAPVVNVSINSFSKDVNGTTSKETLDLSPADRLFTETSEIVHQLRKNNNVIIVIDEIDKIHKNDPQDTILERLRDAKDTGKLRVHLSNGEYEDIDVSRTVFICISNERRECWGLPAVELSPAQAAARTYMDRDKSLVNRFDVVEFEYFKTEDYMVILKPLVEQLQKAYSQTYNMTLEFSEDFAKNVASVAFEKNKGVRGLNDFLIKLRGVLVDVRSKNHIVKSSGAESASSWKVTVDYDKSRDDFTASAAKVEAGR